jgi:Cys-rich four helix bundle protein (predicted Tat secretion target)
MKRRDLFRGGSAIAASHVLLGLGCSGMGAHAAHGEHTTPAALPGDPRRAKLAEAANACVLAGRTCLSHCITLLSQGDTSMAACARTVREMLAICTATAELATTDSNLLAALAKVCADACRTCAEACAPHVGHHEVCGSCERACQATVAAAAALA